MNNSECERESRRELLVAYFPDIHEIVDMNKSNYSHSFCCSFLIGYSFCTLDRCNVLGTSTTGSVYTILCLYNYDN